MCCLITDTLDIEAPAISPRALAKQLNLGNPNHLEKRIKRELEEQGNVKNIYLAGIFILCYWP